MNGQDYMYAQPEYTQTAYQMSPFQQFFYLALAVYFLIVGWKIFEKAGQAGWKSLIPFYNTYILLKIVGQPGWWLLLFFIPFVNLIIWIIVGLKLGKVFGKDGLWSFFLIVLLPFIGLSLLAFSKNTYKKPKGK